MIRKSRAFYPKLSRIIRIPYDHILWFTSKEKKSLPSYLSKTRRKFLFFISEIHCAKPTIAVRRLGRFRAKRINENGVKSCAIPRGTETRERAVVPAELRTRNLPSVFSLASPVGWMDNEKSFSPGTPAGLYITRCNSLVSRSPGSLHFARLSATRGKRRNVNRFATSA